MAAELMTSRRPSRWRLYGPFLALFVLAAVWSVAWVVIRNRVASGLDEWIASEGAAGRTWTCPDRDVGGYPFRIEIVCSGLKLERRDLSVDFGRLHAVAQVYNPSHVIAEVAGPLRATSGGFVATATWRLLQASVMTRSGAQRADVLADQPTIRIELPGSEPVAMSARSLESHVRPSPSDPTAADWALSTSGAIVPELDPLVGGTEPSDIDIILAVTKAYDLPARPLWSELERWRAAEGRLNLSRLSLRKGTRRIEAKGEGRIDDLHRPAGQLDISASGLDGILGRLTGSRGGLAGGLIGALLGAPPAAATSDPTAPRPLPPLRLDGGRVYFGPLAIPSIRVPPLY